MPSVFICISISPICSGEVSGEAYGELVSQLESNEFMRVHSLSHGTWLSVLLCLIYTVPSAKRRQREGGNLCLSLVQVLWVPRAPRCCPLHPEFGLSGGNICGELQTSMTVTKEKNRELKAHSSQFCHSFLHSLNAARWKSALTAALAYSSTLCYLIHNQST